MRESLTRKDRLRKKGDFQLLFRRPDIKSGCRGAKLIARRNGLENNRFAPALVRKYGNSVQRNYSRRILKEIYRYVKREISTGYDIIVILYPGEYGYHDREQQFMSLVRRAGLVKTDP